MTNSMLAESLEIVMQLAKQSMTIPPYDICPCLECRKYFKQVAACDIIQNFVIDHLAL